MATQTIAIIRFGDLMVDFEGRRVLREGQRISMGPQEFKLLETLIANRGRVLTGDELRILVWSDDPSRNAVPAGDVNALYVSIRKLRAALGDHGKFVVNIPKVGYTVSQEAFPSETVAERFDPVEYGTAFVGRTDELALVLKALESSRLVTLTGPPGIGKSRLAVECSQRASRSTGRTSVFVDLAPIADNAFVAKAVLTALGVSEHPGRDAEAELIESLKEKSWLVVLDNCEHLVSVVSSLADKILIAAREVRIIATSREPLLLAGETVLTVGPLNVPEPGDPYAAEFDAVKLFIGLAKRRRPDLELTKRDLATLVELCRQLEGIPVAIELAAVQVDAYTVDQILSVMKDRLRVLQRRGSDSSRHQTLEGAIDWSYGLLSDPEKLLLQRLSVFSGGWTSDLATRVCGGGEVQEDEVVHHLAGLVRRSLIQLGVRKGHHRYRMLEMIRQFARRRLSESGEEAVMRDLHTAEILRLAETAFEAGEKDDWPEILEAEYDNIRAVLRRTITLEEDISAGLRLCGFLVRFWFNHGHLNEARSWTTQALAKDDGTDAEARARALVSAGFFFGQMPGSGSDAMRGKQYFEESIRLFRGVGDKRNTGFALQSYAFLLNRLGEYENAIACAEEALATFQPINDHANAARAANNLGLTLMDMGEFARAADTFDLALRASRRAKDAYLEAVLLHNLADVNYLTSDLEKAAEYLKESLELFRPLQHRPLIARTVLLEGEVTAATGDLEAALDHQKDALRELDDLGDNQGIAWALEAIASTLTHSKGQATSAAELLSAAEVLREQINIHLGPSRQKLVDATRSTLISAIGEGEFEMVRKAAEFAPTSEAVEKALSL